MLSVILPPMPEERRIAPASSGLTPHVGEESSSAPRRDPSNYFWLSVFLPGAGQVAQRRFVTAAVQAATVGSYLVAASTVGDGSRSLWLALAWNVWSAVDAYWHERSK